LLQQIINAIAGCLGCNGCGGRTHASDAAWRHGPVRVGDFRPAILATFRSERYAFVVYSGTGTLTGGDATTAIVGDNISYSGGATTVLGTGTSGVSAIPGLARCCRSWAVPIR